MGLGASEFQEKISQRKDVFPAFCQCRNPQSELIEPVEQVFPEASFSDGFFQILIGGGNQPDIKRVFFRGTYRLAAFLLQGPEQEHLCLIGKVAYLVQKQCPSVNGTEQSDLVAFRTGKGSLLMTEKLGGGKLIGNGPAVDSQIRLVLPMAPGMYLGCNVLLPGAGSPTEQNGDAAYYRIPTNPEEVAQLLLLYENAGGSEAEYWIDYDYRRLRLMVEISSFDSGEVERELNDIAANAARLFPEASVTTVGSIPQFTVMMQYVARGQMVSFAISLLIIGILMMLVFGSVRIGLIGLIPNITPALVVGGLMGWLGYPLDMMTATIMPMILGLAVDDTIHFINHGHLEFDRRGNYRDAILRSFRTIGTPIILTSVVICANFAIYMTSEGLSFIHMGLLSVAGIVSALVADLCVTPVLFQKFRLFGKEIETNETIN